MAENTLHLSGDELAAVRQLINEAACRTLIEAYAYAVDWKNWSGLAKLFWDDASFDFGMWSGDTAGFIPWVTALEAGYSRRLHMLAIPRMHVGSETGHAETGNCTVVRGPNDQGIDHDNMIFGRYQFDFARRHGEWRISALRFLMHGIQSLPSTDNGGAPFYADNMDTTHPLFAQ
jgi:hypothetical protein